MNTYITCPHCKEQMLKPKISQTCFCQNCVNQFKFRKKTKLIKRSHQMNTSINNIDETQSSSDNGIIVFNAIMAIIAFAVGGPVGLIAWVILFVIVNIISILTGRTVFGGFISW